MNKQLYIQPKVNFVCTHLNVDLAQGSPLITIGDESETTPTTGDGDGDVKRFGDWNENGLW